MDYTVHGILQARILEQVAISFSRGSSQPRNWTQVSRVAGGFFPSEPPEELEDIDKVFMPSGMLKGFLAPFPDRLFIHNELK